MVHRMRSLFEPTKLPMIRTSATASSKSIEWKCRCLICRVDIALMVGRYAVVSA